MAAVRNVPQALITVWVAFCCRLSRDDDNEGDSNSIQHQDKICQGYFHRSKYNFLNLNCNIKWNSKQRGMKLTYPSIF